MMTTALLPESLIAAPAMSGEAYLLCFFMIALVPLAITGMALLNAGLGRSHSASHSMLSSLCVVAVAAIVFMVCGFAFQGYAGLPAHALILGGKPWDLIGGAHWFLRGLGVVTPTGNAQISSGIPLTPVSGAPLAALLGMLSVGLAALVPLSAGADRWKLAASCASTALLAGVIYPVFAHWAWGGGWLAQLGVNYGLGAGLVDVGGAGTIHAVAGLTALSITWILGPRRAKFAPDGRVAAAIPAHNIVLVVLGCLLLLPGWFGLNAAGAMLFNGIGMAGLPLVAINTLLCASGSAMTAVVFTKVRFSRPDSSLSANGWVAGLVASSAGCAFVGPFFAVLIGIGAGLLLIFTVEFFETRLGIDDPAGAVSVHAVSGIWGLLSLGLAGTLPVRTWMLAGKTGVPGGQMLAQLTGAATLLGLVLPASYFLNKLIDAWFRYRTDEDGERIGMDLHELGAGAYPEFLIHGDEYTQR
jgi:Amt family ammonium transporter